MSETFKTEMMIHEHFKNCRTADIDQHDFAAWLAQHDAEVAKAERERVLREVWSVSPDGPFVAEIVELHLSREDAEKANE